MLRREFLRSSGGLLVAAALPAIAVPARAVVAPRDRVRFLAFDRVVRADEFPAMQAADEICIVRCDVTLPESLRLEGKGTVLMRSVFRCGTDRPFAAGRGLSISHCLFARESPWQAPGWFPHGDPMPQEDPAGRPVLPEGVMAVVFGCTFLIGHPPALPDPVDFYRPDGLVPIGPNPLFPGS